MKNIIFTLLLLLQYACAYDNNYYYYKYGQKMDLMPLTNNSRDLSNTDYYQTTQGIILGVSNKLIVKLDDKKYLQQISNDFNITLEKDLGDNMYLFTTQDNKLTLDIANKLTKEKYIKYAHPDFIKRRFARWEQYNT